MSVNDRLGRLLFIVPYVNHRDGVPLSELAETLGVSVAQIEADLDLLSMVGQPPLTPDHLIDLYVEDDVVYVALDQSLSRPLRLTHEEARAIVLGAKLVGGMGGVDEELKRVLDKIIAVLNPVDRAAVEALSERVAVQHEGAEQKAVANVLRAAVEQQRSVRLQYYSVSSDRQKSYVLKPLALLTHSGVQYLVALDVEADDQEKLFRLDRTAAAQDAGTAFVRPEGFDLEKFRTKRLYFGHDALHATVRFPPHLVGQIREHFAAHDINSADKAGVQVRVATSSVAWLARWALGFEDAEILQPQICRDYMHRLCCDAAAAYRRPVPVD